MVVSPVCIAGMHRNYAPPLCIAIVHRSGQTRARVGVRGTAAATASPGYLEQPAISLTAASQAAKIGGLPEAT